MTSDDRSTQGHNELDPTLERVYRRGYQLRARRRLARAISTAMVVVLIGSGGALAFTKLKDRQRAPQIAIIPGSPDPRTIPPLGVASAPLGRPSASPRSMPTRTASATGATDSCHNSFDETCGDFHWITPPGSNSPTRISMPQTAEAVVGHTFTVVVTVSDADAPLLQSYRSSFWGDDPHETLLAPPIKCTTAYGGWTPPSRKSGRQRFTYTHVYKKEGTFRVTFAGDSSSGSIWKTGCQTDAYAGSAFGSITVTVVSDTSPSPSPSST